MRAVADAGPLSCQRHFQRRWGDLRDPHVRDLAWLLDSPDLLDPSAPQWEGKIATLGAEAGSGAASWMRELDCAPAALHAFLELPPYARLGRYAEKLMAFYFRRQGILLAHGLQVQAGKDGTVGEFDFLLRRGDQLVHWEFATKFYLLREAPAGPSEADCFVGPSLADTLGAKMGKILQRQLALGKHPAAQPLLPHPVASAGALVKGWLFYRQGGAAREVPGVSAAHCRGSWCPLEELEPDPGQVYAILPRLAWLAPARLALEQAVPAASLRESLAERFASGGLPQLVALLEPDGSHAVETSRIFVVPDDWGARAIRSRSPA
ncbi:MAG: DUF1853 family protein [Noviherbaspirillum sp.]